MIVFSAEIKNLVDELKKTNLETYYHCLNVKKLVNKILLNINSGDSKVYTAEEIDYICKGALLHDIGKLYVRNYVLTKEGRLDGDEREEIHRHTSKGYEALENELETSEKEIIKNICLYHHERIDGNGYYKKTDIPIYVQIVAVCDVFEALTSDRPYHDAMPADKALELIEKGGCGVFDEKIIEYLKETVCD